MSAAADLVPLLDRLTAAPDLETGATACLRRLLDVAGAALARSSYRRGEMLRAMLHVRPGSGYEGLYVLHAGRRELSAPSGSQALLPSVTVWRYVSAGRRPAVVDVATSSIRPLGTGVPAVAWPALRLAEPRMSAESRVRLLDRDATHLCVLPVAAPGRIVGMVSLEAACIDAAGKEFVWDDCAADLELVVRLAGPYLAALPGCPHEGLPGDDLLPVVGPTMARVIQVLRAFAAEDETLLLCGETGTGKSRLARWCHARSPRADGPFEVLDLLSVPEETQMGELVGWRRGAFTGAVTDHSGFVARAEGGTLFIDEVDKLSLKSQAGLLHLLEERRYRPLGDNGPPRTADVRFVVGTNEDLHSAVREGRFREDLYYRLDVLAMALPPLRERSDEVTAWAEYMLRRRHSEKGASGEVALSAEAALALAARPWPGNLRELDNVLRRAYTLASLDAGGGDVTIEARHADQRPASAAGIRSDSPLHALDAAAEGLVRSLVESSPTLEALDLPGALHGLVLAHAVGATGSREAAFRLVGRGELVRNRNHHKALRRDCERTGELFEALGEPLPDAVVAVLDSFR